MKSEEEINKKIKETRILKKQYFLALESLKELITLEQRKATDLTQTLIEETRLSQYVYDPDLFKDFLREPYFIAPVKEGVWRVAIPKFIKFNVGFYEYSTNTYNAFLVNRFASFFGEIPKELERKFQFKDRLPLKIFDGMLLTGKDYQDEAWKRYTQHLSRREGSDRIRIKRGHEFNLQGKLLEDGILPYFAQPVNKELLRKPEIDFTLYDFQSEAWQTFLEKGAAGIYWLMGSGKTFLGLYALASIKGKKLIIVPSSILVEQWRKRLRAHTKIEHEVTIATYQLLSMSRSQRAERIKKQEYSLIVYDEAHSLPAETYERLAGLKTLHRLGLSATPFREDGNSWKILALTGYPIGMNWEELFAIGIVKKPDILLYLGKTFQDKKKKLEELLTIPVKTVVFCDSIDVGKKLSKEFEYPFVHGETNPKERISIIDSSEVCFLSRVGDQGLSLDIPRVIEFDFFKGSRRQEIQRMGRVMHREEKGQHIILMTYDEYESHHKRIDVLEQKGLRVSKVSVS